MSNSDAGNCGVLTSAKMGGGVPPLDNFFDVFEFVRCWY